MMKGIRKINVITLINIFSPAAEEGDMPVKRAAPYCNMNPIAKISTRNRRKLIRTLWVTCRQVWYRLQTS